MRASLRQMLPQILFWLMTIFITHYLTKVSPICHQEVQQGNSPSWKLPPSGMLSKF